MDEEADDPQVPPPDETASEVPRETRGVLWIVVPALAGLVLGALFDVALLRQTVIPALWGEERTTWAALADGGTVGVIVGGAIGTFIWVFLPYKRSGEKPAGP